MKVLILSGVPIRTDTNSGKTLQTLFSGFAKNELAQLYFSPEKPNIDMCESYYQICEKQMLKSCFGLLKNRCGGTVVPSAAGAERNKTERNALKLTKNKRTIFVRLARECVWSITHWDNAKLKMWLQQEKPDVIFAIMQDTNGAIKALRSIAKATNCKIILYITDDYYNDPENSRNFLRKLYYKQRKNLYADIKKSLCAVIGCSEKITAYFKAQLQFEGPTATVYTPAAAMYTCLPYKTQDQNSLVTIRYFGNLGLGRWQLLKQLGLTVQKINSGGKKAILEVYSSDMDPDTHKALTIENGCIYKGWVHGQEYYALLQNADIAVHVESFEQENIRRTWGSISTKIADYLGAGKCILAIGPLALASIDHIQEVSCVVSDLTDLQSKLETLILDAEKRTELQLQARSLANRAHDLKSTKMYVRCIVQDAVKHTRGPADL